MYSHNRLFTLICCILAISGVYAQQIKFGVSTGIQLSHPKEFSSHLGFCIGAKGELAFSQNENTAYLDYGTLLSAKGWKMHLHNVSHNDKAQWNCCLYYLTVPVHVGYKHAVSNRVKLFATIGPYFAVGLYGKSDIKNSNGNTETTPPYAGNLFGNGAYKRFDFGAGAKVGVEISNKFQVMVGYDMGLIKPTGPLWDTLSPKDRTASLSMAYLF